MNLLLKLYPGNQMVVVLITTLVLISSAILIAFVWTQIAMRKNAAMRSAAWIAVLVCALLGPVLVYAAVRAGVHVVAFSLPAVQTSPAPLPSSDLTMPAAALPQPEMETEISRKSNGPRKTPLVQSPEASKPAVAEAQYAAKIPQSFSTRPVIPSKGGVSDQPGAKRFSKLWPVLRLLGPENPVVKSDVAEKV